MNNQKEQTKQINVEVFKQQLLKRKITTKRFRLPWSYETSVDAITAAYKANVQYRHRCYQDDLATQNHIKLHVGSLPTTQSSVCSSAVVVAMARQLSLTPSMTSYPGYTETTIVQTTNISSRLMQEKYVMLQKTITRHTKAFAHSLCYPLMILV